MAEIRIKDVASVQSIKDSDKFPVSIGDDSAHTCTAKVLKTYIGAGGGLTEVTWNDIKNKPTFSEVAETGSYNSLIEKPTIPTTTSQLTNNSGFTTITEVESKGYLRRPSRFIEKGGIADITVADNSIVSFDSPVSQISLTTEKTFDIGTNIYFTTLGNCTISIPPTFMKIGDFEHLLPNQRYVMSLKDQCISIAKEGYFEVGSKQVVELSGEMIDIQLEPNKIYLIDCMKDNQYAERITILNNLSTFDESQIFVKNVQKPVQLVLPNDVIKFGNVPTEVNVGQILKLDIQLNTYTGYIGG